ncbi:MAG: hypothetical protein AAF530_24810 [Pseudomonadota bacterium]
MKIQIPGLIWGLSFLAVCLSVTLTVMPQAQAASDYIVVQKNRVVIGNQSDAVNPLFRTFILPRNVNRSRNPQNSAILQYSVQSVDIAFNEIYLNPPVERCLDQSADDNQSASISLIPFETANTEIHARHSTFRANRLQSGKSCRTGSDCKQSGFCEGGFCRNRLMICSRNSAGTSTGGLDNFIIRALTIHYRLR